MKSLRRDERGGGKYLRFLVLQRFRAEAAVFRSMRLAASLLMLSAWPLNGRSSFASQTVAISSSDSGGKIGRLSSLSSVGASDRYCFGSAHGVGEVGGRIWLGLRVAPGKCLAEC